jgi:hypothetical protein
MTFDSSVSKFSSVFIFFVCYKWEMCWNSFNYLKKGTDVTLCVVGVPDAVETIPVHGLFESDTDCY